MPVILDQWQAQLDRYLAEGGGHPVAFLLDIGIQSFNVRSLCLYWSHPELVNLCPEQGGSVEPGMRFHLKRTFWSWLLQQNLGARGTILPFPSQLLPNIVAKGEYAVLALNGHHNETAGMLAWRDSDNTANSPRLDIESNVPLMREYAALLERTVLSELDRCTGLPIKSAFSREVLEWVNTQDEKTASLLMLRFDTAMEATRSLGEPIGNHVMQGMLTTLETRIRSRDVAGWFEPYTLAVLLKQCELADAHRVARVLREMLSDVRFHYPDSAIDAKLSTAVAALPKRIVLADLNQLVDLQFRMGDGVRAHYSEHISLSDRVRSIAKVSAALLLNKQSRNELVLPSTAENDSLSSSDTQSVKPLAGKEHNSSTIESGASEPPLPTVVAPPSLRALKSVKLEAKSSASSLESVALDADATLQHNKGASNVISLADKRRPEADHQRVLYMNQNHVQKDDLDEQPTEVGSPDASEENDSCTAEHGVKSLCGIGMAIEQGALRVSPGVLLADPDRVTYYRLRGFGSMHQNRIHAALDNLTSHASRKLGVAGPVFYFPLPEPLMSERFLVWLLANVQERHLSLRQIGLIVKEQDVMRSLLRNSRLLARMRAEGVGIMLICQAQSSFSSIIMRRLKPHFVEVAQHALTHADCSEISRRELHALIEEAHSLGAQVCCSGVDTQAVWHASLAKGVDIGFGRACGKSTTMAFVIGAKQSKAKQ